MIVARYERLGGCGSAVPGRALLPHHPCSGHSFGVALGHEHATSFEQFNVLSDIVERSGRLLRSMVYAGIAAMLGLRTLHTAEVRSIEDARAAYRAAREVIAGLPERGRG